MRVRKNILALTDPERIAFFRALLTLKTQIVNPAAPPSQRISVYDLYAAFHQAIFSIRTPIPPPVGGFQLINGGHGGPAFGPWHRELLLRFELALQSVDPTVMLPYWDWTDHAGTQTLIFSDAYFGPNGGAGGAGGVVASGYFAFNAPSPLPAWWPSGLLGWRISSLLAEGEGTSLRRFLGNDELPPGVVDPFAGLATKSQVATLMGATLFEGAGGFRNQVEVSDPFHNFVHRWVSGHMETGASPNDPLFFLHHCNIDRLWAMWQQDGHAGVAGYPSGTSYPRGHNLNDPMWPWVGTATGYSAPNLAAAVAAALPDYSGEPARRPIDLLEHRNIMMTIAGVPTQLGYAYDTEVVVGVSLDRSGSMTGPTPDPMTGAGTVTKWTAATQGVSHFLQDCEAAYAAGEAYVTAGVQTFTSLAAPSYTNVFGGAVPYGLIKAGTSFSAAAFTSAIGGMSASGGTPLAGALVATEDQLVRPPHGDRPPDDRRYLFILTDGMLTSGPPLSSLAEPEFPDTTIFAMGFGVGSGWNGVDYATIQDLTEKGRAAPSGVTQVFHGDNAGTIDKFFTQSIAAAIGYVPMVDPSYELFPGESAMTRFYATSADQGFMVAVVGFDYTDRNWSVMLHAPDGSMYHDSATSPCFVTLRRGRGRTTIFVDRNGVGDARWVGRWDVMVTYMPKAEPLGMVMFSPWQNLVPVGAPPVRGPLFARVDQPAAKRATARLSLDDNGRTAFPSAALGTIPAGPPAAVAVEVYAKTRLDVRLELGKARFAGDVVDADVRFEALAGGKIDELRVIGRLVAPGFSIGNLLADTDTIEPAQRSKLVDKKTGVFDEARFLAALETRRPDVVRVRDEQLDFMAREGSAFTTRVENTRFPGVYWVTAQIDGMWQPPGGGRPQRFLRVIARQAPLGIRIDREAARPELLWLDKNRLQVRFFAGDRFGNLASTTRMAAPVLRFARQALVAEYEARLDGWHTLTVKVEPGKTAAADCCLPCAGGDRVSLPSGTTRGFSIAVGGQIIAIEVAKPDTTPQKKPTKKPTKKPGGDGHDHDHDH